MDSRSARLAVKHTVPIQLVGNQWVANFHRSRDKFVESKWRICKYQSLIMPVNQKDCLNMQVQSTDVLWCHCCASIINVNSQLNVRLNNLLYSVVSCPASDRWFCSYDFYWCMIPYDVLRVESSKEIVFFQTHRYKASRAAATLQIAKGFLVVSRTMLSQLSLERPRRVRTREIAQALTQFLLVEIAQVLRCSRQMFFWASEYVGMPGTKSFPGVASVCCFLRRHAQLGVCYDPERSSKMFFLGRVVCVWLAFEHVYYINL